MRRKSVLTIIPVLIALLCTESHAQEINYDEDKVGDYTLPELLTNERGEVVKTKEDWENKRRDEILKLFETHVYGKLPTDHDSIAVKITNEEGNAMGGAAHLKEVEISVYRKQQAVRVHLILFIPNHIQKPASAFLLINNRSAQLTAPTRDTFSGFWPAKKVVEAGYAIAAFHVRDAAPDHKDTYQNGMLRLYPELLEADDGIKAIGAWGWAASRVLDYFEMDSAVDATKTVLVGHSRGGKAALWAAASDERFAICISNNSGTTGAALSRRNFGETVARINTRLPHWFNDNYKKYNDKVHLLPVDQHMLIALLAPRPLYVTSASEDLWADPKGTFLAVKHAEPVYELYGLVSRLPDNEGLTLNNPVYEAPLGYHTREGKHNMTNYDWEQFLKFADYHFKGKP